MVGFYTIEGGPRSRRIGEAGFTLIEIVMVIVIIGVIGLTVGMLMFQGTASVKTMSARSSLRAQGVLVTERLSRELRLIKCTTVGVACTPSAALTDINTWTDTELRYVTPGFEGRGVRYSGTDLFLRQGAGGTDPEYLLASDVSAFTLTYLKKDGTAATTVQTIWTVVADITLSKDGENVVHRVAVHPRSFR